MSTQNESLMFVVLGRGGGGTLVVPLPPRILFYLKFVTVYLFFLVTLSTPPFGTEPLPFIVFWSEP